MYKVRRIYFAADSEDVEFGSELLAREYVRELIKSPFSEGGAFQIRRIRLLEVVEEELMCVEFRRKE